MFLFGKIIDLKVWKFLWDLFFIDNLMIFFDFKEFFIFRCVFVRSEWMEKVFIISMCKIKIVE